MEPITPIFILGFILTAYVVSQKAIMLMRRYNLGDYSSVTSKIKAKTERTIVCVNGYPCEVITKVQ